MASRDRRVVIVGGGITGALTAHQLAEAGWDVTLLEAEHVGAGSSSRTAAGIRQQFSTVDTVRGMRWSVRFYTSFTDRVGGSVTPIVQQGYLFLCGGDADLARARARVAMQREAGLTEVELLDGDEVRARFPWVDPSIRGATFCPTDGFLLPEVVYNEAMEAARRHGARVVQHARTTGAEHQGGRLVAVQTPRGRFEADLFIDATNAWTGKTAEALGAEPLDVTPYKRFLWFLARGGSMTAEELARMPMTVCPTGVYCRPENEASLMVGKVLDTPPEPGFDYTDQDLVPPEFSHTGGIDSHAYAVWAELAETLPPVGEFDGFTATTAGFYAVTPDHNPFLGYDRHLPNLMRLVGFSGHGAMFGPFTATLARALAEAGRDLPEIRLDGDVVSLDAFRIGRQYTAQEELVI